MISVDALHYAISAKPRRIHCVDMNPCQVRLLHLWILGIITHDLVLYFKGHLLELKLAAASALTYEEFWGTCLDSATMAGDH